MVHQNISETNIVGGWKVVHFLKSSRQFKFDVGGDNRKSGKVYKSLSFSHFDHNVIMCQVRGGIVCISDIVVFNSSKKITCWFYYSLTDTQNTKWFIYI